MEGWRSGHRVLALDLDLLELAGGVGGHGGSDLEKGGKHGRITAEGRRGG
jgi:hypothetical protein